MKKIWLLALSIFTITVFFASCGEDTTQLAKEEFSKYYNGKNEVALVFEDVIYIEKNQLDLKALANNEEPNNGLIIKQNILLFSTCVENSMFDFTLNIYQSNLQGTETKLLFSKGGFKTHPWCYAIDNNFYIEHYSKNAFDEESRLIDRYSINDNKYENIDRGKECSLSDFFQKEEPNQYNIEMIENSHSEEHGKFIIKNLETGLEQTIDHEYLKNTIYIESIEMFGYGPKRVDISNGHILLTYGIGAGNGWNYPHLVFEYNFENKMLEYKLLAFPSDSIPIKIIYIG